MRPAANFLAKLPYQPRLADTRLALNQDDLPLTSLGAIPGFAEHAQFIFAADERSQGLRRLQAAAHPGGALHAEDLDRMRETLKVVRPERFDGEEPGDQTVGRARDREGAGRSSRLHAGGRVRCFANGCDLAPLTSTEMADHDLTRINAGAHRNLTALGQATIDRLDRLDYLEAGTHRPFGVVAMRSGPAEVCDDPVALVLRDIAVEASNHAGNCLVVGLDD